MKNNNFSGIKMTKLKEFSREHWLKITFFLLGLFLGYFIFSLVYLKGNEEKFLQTRFKGSYEFINPLVECDDNSQTVLNKYIPFEAETKKRIQDEVIGSNPNINIAFYFRNLNNGPWFGLNEDEKFAPASLLKVPIIMALLKESENNPSILNKTILYEKSIEGSLVSQNTVINKPLQVGKSYSIEELMEAMIDDSNNEALFTLKQNISQETINKVYQDLGITILDIRGPSDFISVKEYASFFRILYNAAYLEKDTSEKALKILSESEFHDGLEAGIPKGLKIAHKFGERQIINQDGSTTKQLHDCGIIYYEKYPYLLCVMTKGNNTNDLSNIIKDISKIIYSEISGKYP